MWLNILSQKAFQITLLISSQVRAQPFPLALFGFSGSGNTPQDPYASTECFKPPVTVLYLSEICHLSHRLWCEKAKEKYVGEQVLLFPFLTATMRLIKYLFPQDIRVPFLVSCLLWDSHDNFQMISHSRWLMAAGCGLQKREGTWWRSGWPHWFQVMEGYWLSSCQLSGEQLGASY